MPTHGGPGLPHELLTAVFKHLPEDDLRIASQASWDFYRDAHAAGLALHRKLHTDEPNDLETFADIVEHAQAQPHLFRLKLSLVVFRRPFGYEVGLPLWADVWATIRRAMPFLISMKVELDSDVLQVVYAALDTSAPHLREFSIGTFMEGTVFFSVQTPASLFGGDAPCLRSVELSAPVLPPTGELVPAWRGVRALRLRSEWSGRGQPLAVSRFFPGLSNLVLLVICRGDDRPRVVDLGGLNLDSLTVSNDVDIPLHYATPPARVGTLKNLSPAVCYDAAVWPDPDDQQVLTARIQQECCRRTGHLCEVVTVGAVDEDTSRYAHYGQLSASGEMAGPYTLSALEALPQLPERLVSLTVDDEMVVRLLRTERTLAALRELYVACTPPAPPTAPKRKTTLEPVQPEHKISSVWLRCPALERITMFATENATPAVIGRERIAPLGELRVGKSVLLVLAGVTVKYDNMDGPLLRDVFFQVRVLEDDVSACAPAYYHRREENPRFIPGPR